MLRSHIKILAIYIVKIYNKNNKTEKDESNKSTKRLYGGTVPFWGELLALGTDQCKRSQYGVKTKMCDINFSVEDILREINDAKELLGTVRNFKNGSKRERKRVREGLKIGKSAILRRWRACSYVWFQHSYVDFILYSSYVKSIFPIQQHMFSGSSL